MMALIKKDATLTLKAGQVVELDEKQFALAEKLGFAERVKETKKKGAAK